MLPRPAANSSPLLLLPPPLRSTVARRSSATDSLRELARPGEPLGIEGRELSTLPRRAAPDEPPAKARSSWATLARRVGVTAPTAIVARCEEADGCLAFALGALSVLGAV
ncbi:hypothetical protein T492DRAFT_966808 [Pavlovales sp. CCMP2436]|nr:hypothetical protein T492DRAFT_966808 [Pavlovales sp. CCMP2436]